MPDENDQFEQVLVALHNNQIKLANHLDSLAVKISDVDAGLNAVAEVVDDNEEKRLKREAIEVEKQVVTNIFKKSQRYARVIVFIFFGTYFALYSIVKDSLNVPALHLSAILIMFSASVLAIYEVLTSVWTNWSLMKRLSNLKIGISLVQVGAELQSGQRSKTQRLRHTWIVALILSLGGAILGLSIFLDVLIRSVWSAYIS